LGGGFLKTETFIYKAILITAEDVIPAKAGIQKKTGFRVKPGMTNHTRLISSCINESVREKKGVVPFKFRHNSKERLEMISLCLFSVRLEWSLKKTP